jgi:hypothetical protein
VGDFAHADGTNEMRVNFPFLSRLEYSYFVKLADRPEVGTSTVIVHCV